MGATPLAHVTADLAMLHEQQQSAMSAALLASPAEALRRIVAELSRYWEIAVEPLWSRDRRLLQADLAYRMEQLASGGVDQPSRTLNPRVDFRHDTLLASKAYAGRPRSPLVGCWCRACSPGPEVLIVTAPPHQPTMTYSPRGIGLLWQASPVTPESPLADPAGRSRAAIVAQLDLPISSTQLACKLNLSHRH